MAAKKLRLARNLIKQKESSTGPKWGETVFGWWCQKFPQRNRLLSSFLSGPPSQTADVKEGNGEMRQRVAGVMMMGFFVDCLCNQAPLTNSISFSPQLITPETLNNPYHCWWRLLFGGIKKLVMERKEKSNKCIDFSAGCSSSCKCLSDFLCSLQEQQLSSDMNICLSLQHSTEINTCQQRQKINLDSCTENIQIMGIGTKKKMDFYGPNTVCPKN